MNHRCIHCPTPVPVPNTRCAACRKRRRSYHGPRMFLTLRCPYELYQEAKTLATLNDETLTDWIVAAIQERVTRCAV